MAAKISIVIPSYNQGQFLEETLKSVFSQDYKDFEVLLVDGGSTDNSLEIIKKYDSKLKYWCSEKDDGQADAINKGFKHSQGQILCWLNSDDKLAPGALKFAAETLNPNQNQWLIGASRSINKHGKTARIRYQSAVSLDTFLEYKKYWFSQPSVFWTKEMWDQVCGVTKNYHYIMDLDIFYSMYCLSLPIITKKVLSSYRVHSDAKTSKDHEKVDLEYAKWLEKLIKDGHKGKDITDKVLTKYVSLQRVHRTVQEHIVLSRIAKFWKRYINKNIYI